MNLTVQIESAENQFKQILEEFFISVYDEKSLSSHGIDHHRRVWSYSKELLELIPYKNNLHFFYLPSKLIIASYMHDIGMSVDPGMNHGKYSRDLCSQFLVRYNLPENEYHDVLEAIEYHDNKDYTTNTPVNDLLTLLSVSDDLDAFGYTGIFRYAEIYLTRGIDPENIGHLIRENAARRFSNFVKTFGTFNEMVQKHRKRYKTLDNFFSKYNKQAPSYQFSTKHPTGYCGVVELLILMIKDKKEIKEFYLEPDKYLVDPVICWFFNGLAHELS